MADSRKEWVALLGERITEEIERANIPHVEEALLDDFNSQEGRIFVLLRMEQVGRMGNYYLVERPDNLRKTSAGIRAAASKVSEVRVGELVSPQKQYVKRSYMGSSPDGYNTKYIYFDYTVVADPPRQELIRGSSPDDISRERLLLAGSVREQRRLV